MKYNLSNNSNPRKNRRKAQKNQKAQNRNKNQNKKRNMFAYKRARVRMKGKYFFSLPQKVRRNIDNSSYLNNH